MRGIFFGYKKMENCQQCNSLRIGHDYNDQFYVTPGELKIKEASCKFSGWVKKRLENKYTTRNLWDKTHVVDGEPKHCPECGEAVEKTEIVEEIRDRFGRSYKEKETVFVCVNTARKLEVITLPGCEHCNEYHGV